jgi:hypothetical protein
MNIWYMPQTPTTPEVLLDPALGLLSLKGESYPENVLSFYAPVLERIRAAVEDDGLEAFKVELHIPYYNSASAKALHRILQLLNRAGEKGCAVQVRWQFDAEDEMARDLGTNFREDFPAISLVDVPLAVA